MKYFSSIYYSSKKQWTRKQWIAIVLFVCIATAETYAADYDLSAYLVKVEQNNPDIASAFKELELAKTSVTQARSAFLPSIGVQGGYTRNFMETLTSTPVASLPGGGSLIRQDVRNNFDNELTLGIGVNQTLFNPAAITAYSKAKTGQSIRAESLELVRLNILCAAKKLYAQTQLVLQVVAITESSEQLSQEIYQRTQRRFQAGAAVELDLLMAEVDWKSKSASAVEARKNAELVLIAFRNLAGIPLSETIALTEEQRLLAEIPASPDVHNILTNRPDYRTLLLSRTLADIERKAAVSAFFPTVSASFSYALGGMGNGSSLTGDYDINAAKLSLNVSIPIFVGGARLARIKAAGLEQDKAAITLSKKRNAVETELIALQLRLDEAAQRVESARLIEDAARRAVALAQSAYSNGAATQFTVNEAINRLDQAGLGLQNAIFEYRCACYDWELAAGVME